MSQTSLLAVGRRKSRSRISLHMARAALSIRPYYASSEPWSKNLRGLKRPRAETPAAEVTGCRAESPASGRHRQPEAAMLMSNAHRIVLNTLASSTRIATGYSASCRRPNSRDQETPAVAETVIRSARSIDASCSPSRRQDADKG
jgi:hypothetical protein